MPVTAGRERTTLPARKQNRFTPAAMEARAKAAMRPREAAVHTALCKYIALKYPDVIFTSEGSGLPLTKAQAGKTKVLRSSSKLPDFWMAEPRGIYCGLFLEIKRDHDALFTKEGDLRQAAHLLAQNHILEQLEKKGYWAQFVCGLDEAIEIVDDYMKLPPHVTQS